MFFFIRKLVVYSLVYFFCFCVVQRIEASSETLALQNEDESCAMTQGSSSDCEEQLISDQSIEDLDQMYNDQIQGYFLDIIFENAFCKCQPNDGCTRGCRLESYVDVGQDSTIRRCRERKSVRKSLDRCAQHVTGALMAAVHDFLADHCKNTEERVLWASIDYDQCEKDFREVANSNNANICRHGFKFPHAFCMLNLDGQSRYLYDKISNRGVRSECKSWDRYNQSLLAVNISFDSEQTIIIPLFKKISPERNKEFKEDPSQIPTGAIIVTRLFHRSGHVEVKTDRNECGKNKTQTCFCSDYCRERERYYYPVLAVFEWNPEFIRYVSANRYLSIIEAL